MSQAELVAERTKPTTHNVQDFLPLNGIDHIEFFVGNAKQSAYYYRSAFGFKLTGYAGLETGVRDRASYVLEQGKVRIVLTTPLTKDHPINAMLAKHGDGVSVIALEVDDVEKSFRETTKRGAIGVQEPREVTDQNGTYRTASIRTYGDTIHTFVDRKNYKTFAPTYRAVTTEDTIARPVGLAAVDHIVG